MSDCDSLLRHFEPGDVLTYRPDPERFMPNHCREGIAIVNEHGRAIDTFWSSGYSDAHCLTEGELADATLRFRLSEYRQLGESWDHTGEEWLKYAPADRGLITAQHGLQRTHYVRIGAEPDLDTQIANAREALAKAEHEVESAQRRVEWRKEDLVKLEGEGA